MAKVGRPRNEPVTSFWSKVRANPINGCLEWIAGKPAGYGSFWDGARNWPAHRFAWELVYGPIATGLQLNHKCRNKACVNTAHLEALTPTAHYFADFDLHWAASKTRGLGKSKGARKAGLSARKRLDLSEGVSINCGGRYRAQLYLRDLNQVYLGSFDTPEEASEVYERVRAFVGRASPATQPQLSLPYWTYPPLPM